MFDNGRGRQDKTRRVGRGGGCWYISVSTFAWSRSPVYTGRTKLALFIRRRPENGTGLGRWQRVFAVGQLLPFSLFILFYFGHRRSLLSLPSVPSVASSTLVCLLICLTCVSMMTQHKNTTKSEQNLKDKANRSNSSNNRNNNSSNINKQLRKNSSNINESSSKSLTKTFSS